MAPAAFDLVALDLAGFTPFTGVAGDTLASATASFPQHTLAGSRRVNGRPMA